MKFLVDKMPETPDKCMYGMWCGKRCNSFVMCKLTNDECTDTRTCRFLTDQIPPKEEV